MNFNDGYNQSMYDGNVDINITNQNVNDNTNMNFQSMGYEGGGMMGTTTCPVVEPGRERVVYRNIYHTVPHA